MPQTPQQYGAKRRSRIQAQKQIAARNRERFTQTDKLTIKFSRNQVEFEKIRTFY